MKTLSQYREDLRALMKKVGDIEAKATSENRDLNGMEVVLTNEIFDTIEEMKKIVNTMERQERIAGLLESPSDTVTVEKSQRVTSSQASGVRSQDRFNSFGEQLTSVMEAARPGGKIDPRLYNSASGLNENVSSDGGLI